MRLRAIEDVRDRFPLIRSQGGDIDERFHRLIARRRDNRAGIGMADEHDRPRHALERAVQRHHVFLKRCQRQWRRDDLDAPGRQRPDDLCPARSIGPGAMDEHDVYIV